MAITGEERHELHQHFEESIGRRMAANLMKLLPPEGWGDIATKQDITHQREVTDERFQHTWALMDERFARMDERLERLVGQLRAELYRALWIQGAGLVSVMISISAVMR